MYVRYFRDVGIVGETDDGGDEGEGGFYNGGFAGVLCGAEVDVEQHVDDHESNRKGREESHRTYLCYKLRRPNREYIEYCQSARKLFEASRPATYPPPIYLTQRLHA